MGERHRFRWIDAFPGPGFDLIHGERVLARVRQRRPHGWYWTGFGQSTEHKLGMSLSQARRAAEAQAHLAFRIADRAAGR